MVIYLILSALAGGWSIYQLLPFLAYRLTARNSLSCSEELSSPFHYQKWNVLPAAWRQKLLNRLAQAGINRISRKSIGLIALSIPAILVISGFDLIRGTLLAALGISLLNTLISRRISLRRQAYTRALYKIYRFLDLQLDAGIKVTDVLRGLPDAVQDPIVKPVLIRFAASYELTLDLEQSFLAIHRAFPGMDSRLLSTQLRQSLQTGQAGRSMLRMEEMLFSRCFALMQNDTRKIRQQLLIAGLLGVSPLIILFLFPLIMQALSALQSVFG